MERHARFLHWRYADSDALGVLRIHHRVVWHFGAVWRLLCDDCGVRGWHTHCWAMDCYGIEQVGGRGDESGESGLKGGAGGGGRSRRTRRREEVGNVLYGGVERAEWTKCIIRRRRE
jgi:hypothetical protein